MEQISATLQTAYADLLQMHLNQPDFALEGAPFRVTRAGRNYWYANRRSAAGAAPRQRYLGPDTEDVRNRIATMRANVLDDAEFRRIAQGLVAQLRSGGLPTLRREPGSLLRALSRSGVFRLGGTLVGTHALQQYEIELGVRLFSDRDRNWAIETKDVDIASFEKLSMVIEDKAEPDLNDVLTGLGFRPANSLEPRTPTSWTLPGGVYAIDFLTPSFAETEGPVKLAALNVWAHSLHFLDFLIKEPIPSVLLYMEGLLVQIPRPERYAVHKLIVSQRRSVKTKVNKDVAQARALIHALSELRPYELRVALAEAEQRGKAWKTAIDRALELRFRVPPMRYDFDRDAVCFDGEALGADHRCFISGEALDDHLDAASRSREGRLSSALAHRSRIEEWMRLKFREDPGRETMLMSADIEGFTRREVRQRNS